MHLTPSLVLLMIAAAGMSSCARPAVPVTGSDDEAWVREGTAYRLVSLDSPTRNLVDDTTISMSLTDGVMRIQSGCNLQTAPARVERGALVVKSPSSTYVQCDAAVMEQEAWLTQFLTSNPSIAMQDGELMLALDGTTLTLEATK